MQDQIRRATADDQPVITRLVRHARLNPRGLDWHGFVIAEAGAVPVGVAQVRQHSDGSRELASLVVLAEYRGRSVARRMVDALLADETGPVFTIIDHPYVQHFTRWDFRPVGTEGLPRSMARQLRIGQIVTSIGSLLSRRRIRLQPLRRPPRQPSD